MYTKALIFGIFAFFLVLLQSQAQRNDLDRQLCGRLQNRCAASTARLGNTDDGVNAVNAQCSMMRGRSWRNITRCQLVRASCELTIMKCARFACDTIEKLLQ